MDHTFFGIPNGWEKSTFVKTSAFSDKLGFLTFKDLEKYHCFLKFPLEGYQSDIRVRMELIALFFFLSALTSLTSNYLFLLLQRTRIAKLWITDATAVGSHPQLLSIHLLISLQWDLFFIGLIGLQSESNFPTLYVFKSLNMVWINMCLRSTWKIEKLIFILCIIIAQR